MATVFKKIPVLEYPRVGVISTPDSVYWSKLGSPSIVREFGAINHIDFSPIEPYCFAESSSTHVKIYSPFENVVHKDFGRFRVTAYSGNFRQDGKLLIVGDDDGGIKIFDVATKAAFREFKGHKRAVHKCQFIPETAQIASFSDDKTVCIWDIPTEKLVKSFEEHKDFVRAGAVSSANHDVVISGSYDHTVKVFDRRSNESVLTVDHGEPVEAVLTFPSGGIFVSAGGTDIKVWDSIFGGRLLFKITEHIKTVTCLTLASDGRRMISGSLDCRLKIYDVTSYQAVYSSSYPSPILSVGVAKGDSILAVGMVDGTLSVQRKNVDITRQRKKSTTKKASYKHRLEVKNNSTPMDNGRVERRYGLQVHEQYLKRCNWTAALDHALFNYGFKKSGQRPEVCVAVFQDLIRNGNIYPALAGRTNKQLCLLLQFLNRYINDIRFSQVLLDVASIFLDVSGSHLTKCQSKRVLRYFKDLRDKIAREHRFIRESFATKGAIELLLAGANNLNSTPSLSTADITQTENPSSSSAINDHSIPNAIV